MTWNGQLVEAVRNEYVLRMPQLNAATAKSPVDYQSRLPVVPAGWSTQNLGSGFFKLTAPGASQAALTTWARQQGANYIEDRGQPGRQILRDAQRPAVCKRRQLGVFTNRRARGLPWKGEMLFDTADVNSMMSDGTFLSVVLHEMAHALGFGAVWQQFGLMQGAGTANPIYVGANALREYRTLFGEPRATGVPLETTGGQRTANSHWSERFLVNELMAGFIERPGEPHCRRNRRGLAGSGGGGDTVCVRLLGGPAVARRAGAGCPGARLTAGGIREFL